jgi:hypothetical protein
VTGPDDIRAQFTRHGPAELVAELAALAPPWQHGPLPRTLLSLRELGRRAQFSLSGLSNRVKSPTAATIEIPAVS